ncbi:RDD family protein [Aquimixticola soesokkakensis]|uniref:RDD family protein n=1 Tax=Aquimixticola soesokkakensis TaxID=1519096 RepID=A0A1Y5SPY3_9RHOB|nr:RDD family protein [Aquimixticola soesokkakensis]SLN43954.1 RDD family protein [Aquimixticola soesokkakensis]
MSDPSPSQNWGLPDPQTQAEFYADVALKRALAWVVDALIIALMTGVIVLFTAFIGLFFLPVLWMILSFTYRVISIARMSATPGMRLMGIEFRTASGALFDVGSAFGHTALYAIWVSTGIAQFASMVMIVATERRQSLSDMILGSVVINRAQL